MSSYRIKPEDVSVFVSFPSGQKVYEYKLPKNTQIEFFEEEILKSIFTSAFHFILKTVETEVYLSTPQGSRVLAKIVGIGLSRRNNLKEIKISGNGYNGTIASITEIEVCPKWIKDKLGREKLQSSEKTIFNLSKVEVENTKTNPKGDNLTMKTNTFSNFGRKVQGLFGFSMFDGSPAYKLGGSFFSVKDGQLVDVTEFVMEVDMPGFTMPALVSQITVGDLVKAQGEFAIVHSVEGNTLKVLKGDGSVLEIAPASNPMFGGAFVTKVMNPMSGMFSQGMTNTQGAQQGFNPMMFMLMGKDGNGSDDMFKSMMMMQMMQQQGGFFNQQTPKQETK